MAFGYIETQYRVLADSSHAARNKPADLVHHELRQSLRGDEPPYIAVFTTNANGEILTDLLLRYEDEGTALQDWAKLTGQDVAKLDDLQFIERIEDHCIGYTCDGGVVMY